MDKNGAQTPEEVSNRLDPANFLPSPAVTAPPTDRRGDLAYSVHQTSPAQRGAVYAPTLWPDPYDARRSSRR